MSTQTDTTSQPTASPARPRRRRRVLAVAAAGAAVAAGLALAATSVNVGNISIVSGWFPVALFWATVAACSIAVLLRRDVLKEFAIGIPIGVVLAVLLFVGLHLTQQIPIGAPQSLYVWLCIACLVAGLVVAGWRRAHWPRRICGVVAVLLAVVSAGSAVNQTFAYFTTFDHLFGKSANHFLDNAQLTAMRKEVARTGQLPDHGATLSVEIPGKNLKFTPRPAYVWVPPAWFARNHPQLPVVELLHGTPGDPSNWTKSSSADATALAFAEQHHGMAPILVMPDINGSWGADTECVNSTMFGAVETYLSTTVPEFMRKNFNAKTDPGSVAIAGLSEGGLCATTLALNNPKVYAAFGNYSGDESPTYQNANQQQTIRALFGGSQASYDAHNPPYILAHQRFTGVAGWFAAGAQDGGALQAAHTLQPLASNAGLDTCIETPPGRHSFDFWSQAFKDSLPWLSWKLKLTPEPKPVPAHAPPGRSSRPMAAAIVFAILSALSNACGAVLQRLAVVERTSQARSVWRTAMDLVRQPMWLLGVLFLVGTFGFQALALYFGPLSVVQPVLVLELIFTLGLRVFLLHDDIAPRTWSAALMICLGLAAFLVVALPGEGSHVPNAGQWVLAVSTRGLTVLVLLLLSRYGSPARRAALFGAAAAVVWSVDAAFVKQAVDVLAHGGLVGLLTHWPLYALIVTGVLGTVLLQGAYAVGPLAASQATLLIVDPLVSIALGIELFGEQLRTGPAYVFGAVVSLAVLGAGVVMLSIWAPPVMTAEELARLPGRARSGGERALRRVPD